MTLHEGKALFVVLSFASLPRTMLGTTELPHTYLSAEPVALFHTPASNAIVIVQVTWTSTNEVQRSSQQPWTPTPNVINWAQCLELLNDTCVTWWAEP
jgi:hypothetical protein